MEKLLGLTKFVGLAHLNHDKVEAEPDFDKTMLEKITEFLNKQSFTGKSS